MWIAKSREPNRMRNVEAFLANWDNPTLLEINKKVNLKKSSAGNLNYNGSLDGKKGPNLVSKNIHFTSHLEKGVSDLVMYLTGTLDCITYTSCEGHMSERINSERHVGIIPRDVIDYIRIINFFSSVWNKVTIIESRFKSIRFGIAKNNLLDRNRLYSVLDFYLYKHPGQKWKTYFSEINKATQELILILRNERVFNKGENDYLEHFRSDLNNIYLSLPTTNKFPYTDANYQAGLLEIHKSEKTDQASRKSNVNKKIFSWYFKHIHGFQNKYIIHPLCGPGIEALELSKLGLEKYLGIDQSTIAIDEANNQLMKKEGYKFIAKNIFDCLQFDEKFDIFLLSYEAINSFSESEFISILKFAKDNLYYNGLLCGDIRFLKDDKYKYVNKASIIDTPDFINQEGEYSQILEVTNWNNKTRKLSKYYFTVDYNPLLIANLYDYFTWIPTEKQFIKCLNKFGFTIKMKEKVLEGLYSDVRECRDNVFFIAKM
ncbi:methyltransferase domain-containing protein [Spirosoma foliorum]|uniref:Class I SAM-dependent methyltransferase n=1 Tax=Spirosoma foliorum TaxID=2710596 RepID=A0A7G5GRG9_9BACT|nr:methyltransferase domain-containing protein [Spirosoma foliorum]QMW01461.1 class I SAM-dependent methyltransferase [Spirosoma foliorum]